MAKKTIIEPNLPDWGDFKFEDDEVSGKTLEKVDLKYILMIQLLNITKFYSFRRQNPSPFIESIDALDINLEGYKDDKYLEEYNKLEERYKKRIENCPANTPDKMKEEWESTFKKEQWRLLSSLMKRKGFYPATTM